MTSGKILVGPLLTEKATNSVKNNVYSFIVGKYATKNQIRVVLADLYAVKVTKVRIVTRHGKEKRSGRKMVTKKLPDTKIAYVTLKEGKIDLFPQT